MAEQYARWKMSVVWLLTSRTAVVRKGHCRACTVRVCIRALSSVYIDCAIPISLERNRN